MTGRFGRTDDDGILREDLGERDGVVVIGMLVRYERRGDGAGLGHGNELEGGAPHERRERAASPRGSTTRTASSAVTLIPAQESFVIRMSFPFRDAQPRAAAASGWGVSPSCPSRVVLSRRIQRSWIRPSVAKRKIDMPWKSTARPEGGTPMNSPWCVAR